MNFKDYQEAIVNASRAADTEHEIVPLLGVGAHIGALLAAHQRYLRDAIGYGASKTVLARELGEVLRWCALLAEHNALDLALIASTNLVKIRLRAEALGIPVDDDKFAIDTLHINGYQRAAAVTDQDIADGVDPLSLTVPMLGMAGEVGSTLVETKKRLRGDSRILDWRSFLSEEIGDILWYLAALARYIQVDLESLAATDLTRAIRSSEVLAGSPDDSLRIYDKEAPETERLPRRLVLRFQESTSTEHEPTVTLTLLDATPNAFHDGPTAGGIYKQQGFSVNAQLGDRVTDNAHESDGYRFHDAIHLGFLAVLNWSPNMRSLLRLKRKSSSATDDNDDGARAIFAEEGIAAILAKLAPDYQFFGKPLFVPEELVEIITAVVAGLEIRDAPPWLWRRAVSQGFNVMAKLADGHGGYVEADLDARTLTYSKMPPKQESR